MRTEAYSEIVKDMEIAVENGMAMVDEIGRMYIHHVAARSEVLKLGHDEESSQGEASQIARLVEIRR